MYPLLFFSRYAPAITFETGDFFHEGEAMGIEDSYASYYLARNSVFVYPHEFVVRIFSGKYPNFPGLKLDLDSKILDVGIGDGRNSRLLLEKGYEVWGTEIHPAIVAQTQKRFQFLGPKVPVVLVGENEILPFQDNFFDCILACHVIYYIKEGSDLQANLREYHRVGKKDSLLICSVADSSSYIFKDAVEVRENLFQISSDPYMNRNGSYLTGFKNLEEAIKAFSEFYEIQHIGRSDNDFFGIKEKLWWFVGKRK